jgi:hypothetical protein
MAQMPRRRFMGLATAAAIGLVVGSAATMLSRNPEDRSWQQFAASYHALYITETLSDVRETLADADTNLQSNAKRIGQTIAPGRINAVAGLTLKRSQLLGFEGQPLLQVAYLADGGTPVALCIMKSQAANRNIATASMQGMASAVWVKDGYEYLLIGGTDAAMIKTAAKEFVARL